MTRPIGGTLDPSALAALAGKPDPRLEAFDRLTLAQKRVALIALWNQGMHAADIARAAGISVAAAQALLGDDDSDEGDVDAR